MEMRLIIILTISSNTQDRAHARSFLLAPLSEYSSGKYSISIVRLENLTPTIVIFDILPYHFLTKPLEFLTCVLFDTCVKFNHKPLENLIGVHPILKTAALTYLLF
jgi:hypothetical protein